MLVFFEFVFAMEERSKRERESPKIFLTLERFVHAKMRGEEIRIFFVQQAFPGRDREEKR